MTVWPDDRLLDMLHMLDVEGLSRTVVAQRLGTTKGAILGAYRRVWTRTAREWPGTAGDVVRAPEWVSQRGWPPAARPTGEAAAEAAGQAARNRLRRRYL